MNLPSFNAEASLYRGSAHYGLASGLAGQTNIQVISPQLTREWNGPDLICGDGPFGGRLGLEYGPSHS
jgi:hypothetical protein